MDVSPSVADRGRASGLYRVGITGTVSHASPFTEWSKNETVLGVLGAGWGTSRVDQGRNLESVGWEKGLAERPRLALSSGGRLGLSVA